MIVHNEVDYVSLAKGLIVDRFDLSQADHNAKIAYIICIVDLVCLVQTLCVPLNLIDISSTARDNTAVMTDYRGNIAKIQVSHR